MEFVSIVTLLFTVVCVLLLPFILKVIFKVFMFVIILTVIWWTAMYVMVAVNAVKHNQHQVAQVIKHIDSNNDDGDYGYVSNDDGTDASDMYIDASGNYTIPDFD